MGDNDAFVVVIFDEGGTPLGGVKWDEARERLCLQIDTTTSNPGVTVAKAEELLCGMFTGGHWLPEWATALDETQERGDA